MQKGGRGPYQPQLSPDKVRELQKMIDTERMGDPVHGVQKGIELPEKVSFDAQNNLARTH